MQGAVHHGHMSSVNQEFGYAKLDDEDEGGETGEEAQGHQQAAEEFGKYYQGQGDAMGDMKRVGKDRLKMTEVLKFLETIEIAEEETEYHADGKSGQVECRAGVGGGEELFHV